jgi:hypothetical protein
MSDINTKGCWPYAIPGTPEHGSEIISPLNIVRLDSPIIHSNAMNRQLTNFSLLQSNRHLESQSWYSHRIPNILDDLNIRIPQFANTQLTLHRVTPIVFY